MVVRLASLICLARPVLHEFRRAFHGWTVREREPVSADLNLIRSTFFRENNSFLRVGLRLFLDFLVGSQLFLITGVFGGTGADEAGSLLKKWRGTS